MVRDFLKSVRLSFLLKKDNLINKRVEPRHLTFLIIPTVGGHTTDYVQLSFTTLRVSVSCVGKEKRDKVASSLPALPGLLPTLLPADPRCLAQLHPGRPAQAQASPNKNSRHKSLNSPLGSSFYEMLILSFFLGKCSKVWWPELA